MTTSLALQLQKSPYQSYAYSYPHKTAYRTLPHPQLLRPLWDAEDKSALFLYIHIPFCMMRCGFCNLFTLAQPRGDMAEHYVQQLINQMQMTAEFLGQSRFASFACGGGTPTFLEASQLERLFYAAHKLLELDLSQTPGGIEISPDTATPEKLQLCKDIGFTRISMGLQSFYHAEVQALVRKQTWQQVDQAITRIKAIGFPILNLDLIYGIPGQTVSTFLDTLEATLRYAPQELYLYPLYVRAQTGLGKIQAKNSIHIAQQYPEEDLRMQMYCAGRDMLRSAGYEQVSMRMFRRPGSVPSAAEEVSYSCQNDGMVGLGCGARSYTRELHYSEEYGVARARISDILRHYCERNPQDFLTARYGFRLNREEQQRRFIIQSLLVFPGLSLADYETRFNSQCFTDFPMLQDLIDLELATLTAQRLTLTDKGMSYADAIGPWLVSNHVKQLMQNYQLE